MERLGCKKWGIRGGDWGAAVTLMLGHMALAGLVGIHRNFVMYQPTEEEMANADADENAMMASAQNSSIVCRAMLKCRAPGRKRSK